MSPNGLGKAIRRLRWWVGTPAAIAILALVGRRIYVSWAAIQPVVSQIRPDLALVGIGLVTAAVALLGWNWVSLLGNCGVQVHKLNALRAYFLANLARYVPGGIWHFAGRTLWLIDRGYKSRVAVESLALDQGMTLATAGMVGLALSNLVDWKEIAIGLAVLSGITLLLLAGLRTRGGRESVSHWGQSVSFERGKGGRWALLLLSYGIFWILYGLGTTFLAAAVVGWKSITASICIRLIGQTALSWAAGYVVFLIPGGWGVRELVFMSLLSEDFSGYAVVLLPLLSRLAQIFAEVLCTSVYLMASYYSGRSSSNV